MTKNLRMISALLLLAFAATANANWDGSIASTAPATRDIYSVVEGSSSSMSSSSWDEGIWWSSSSMSSSSVASYSSGYYRNYYVITTPEELAWFAAQVNAGNTAYNAVLDNDIVLYEDSITDANKAGVTRWSAIGKTKATAFKGIFDGNGHTVRGMYVNDTSSSSALDTIARGFFGYVDSLGMVKNLKLKNAYVYAYHAFVGAAAGGAAGQNAGTIKNVSVDGYVGSLARGKYASSYGYSFAGAVAGINRGTIDSSLSAATVFGNAEPSDASEFYVGGIAGSSSGTITNCTNSGKVTAVSYFYTRFSYAGGIAGSSSGTITNCRNSGKVSCSYAGGIAGSSSGTITNCTNSGAVFGIAGGIAGSSSGTITNCTNSGK